MAHDAPQATGPSKLVIRNIGLLLSGALEKPILDADTVVAENGRITAIGRLKDVNTEGATTIVDANGTTVAPGLIDSHVHPVAGDWTPRQNQINWIDSYLHGGVTTAISASEVHVPGRPSDAEGVKALALAAQWLGEVRRSDSMCAGSGFGSRAIHARTSSPRPGGSTASRRRLQKRSTMIATLATASSSSGIIGQPPARTSSSTRASVGVQSDR